MNKKDIIKLDEILLEQTTEYKKFNEAYDILKKRKKKKQNIIIIFSIIVVTLIILIIYLLLNLNYTKREVIIDNISEYMEMWGISSFRKLSKSLLSISIFSLFMPYIKSIFMLLKYFFTRFILFFIL